MINIAVCDDDRHQLNKIVEMVREYADRQTSFEIEVKQYLAPYLLLDDMEANQTFDILILDIIMPALDGIGLARRIRESNRDCRIIYLTSSREYAVDAFSVQASNYLLKPVQKEQLFPALDSLFDSLNLKEAAVLLKTDQGVRKIFCREIMYIEGDNHRQYIYLRDGTRLAVSRKLQELYDMLKDGPEFIMPYRSYIVNVKYILSVMTRDIVMTNQVRIPIRNNGCKDVLKKFMDYTFEEL